MPLNSTNTINSIPDFSQFPTYNAWKKIGTNKRFGVLIPLSQIKSKRNIGVGDFSDLEAFGNFCSSIGCSIIQILPINDMGRGKAPYSSISAFALDPVYIAMDDICSIMPRCKTPHMDKFLQENKEMIYKERAKGRIDFEAVRNIKMGALRAAFQDYFDQTCQNSTDSLQQFNEFKERNSYWLTDYCLFRALKEESQWKPWGEWQKGLKTRSPRSLAKSLKDHKEEIEFYSFVQWLAYTQLTEAHGRLLLKGIFIKGDLPLLVDYESADVWAHPEYFNLDLCGGAPPDQYSSEGQNWGMPTYNWKNLEKDDYILWRERLRFAENFYDIFRIDHVVGLFRIWSIKRGLKTGAVGAFDPQDNGKGHNKPVWEKQGRTLLEMIAGSTNMLPIGEDLGTIPYVCRKTLKDLGIPGYKVLIWERDWNNPKEDFPFFLPEEYPYVSMITSTTHDFWTLAGWWLYTDPDPEKAEAEEELKTALWKFLSGSGERPKNYTDKLHNKILSRLFYSNSVFLIMPFNDLWGTAFGVMGENPGKDRINDPSNPEKEENWSGRIPVEIETLHQHPVLMNKIETIKFLSNDSGRVI